MGLVRLLHFCAAKYNINVCITYILREKSIADNLSHYQQEKFCAEAIYVQDPIDPLNVSLRPHVMPISWSCHIHNSCNYQTRAYHPTLIHSELTP